MECEIKSMVLAAISVVHMETVFCEYTFLTKGNWFTTWHIIFLLLAHAHLHSQVGIHGFFFY